MYDASIILLNSHPAITPPYPTTPNMIEIGGFHIRKEILPQDIQATLDKSHSGAIYFSMGTNVDFRQLGETVLTDVLTVLSKLQQTVVWKLADENLPGKPENVLIRKWLQQRAILSKTIIYSPMQIFYPNFFRPQKRQSVYIALWFNQHVGVHVFWCTINMHPNIC